MIRLAEPNEAAVRAILEREGGEGLSYAQAEMTRGELPPGYLLNFARIELGKGKRVFEAGKAALRGWGMYDLPWIRLYPARPRVEEGTTYATLVHAYGLWSVNLTRVLYMVDEPRRFGFAIGTLPRHMERGEERFLIRQWPDGSVWFQIRAYTSLRHWLARAGSPLAIRLLRRFGREACAALARRVRMH